jgi:hypothetical protein
MWHRLSAPQPAPPSGVGCSSLCFYIMNGLESPFYTSKNVGARHALPLILLFADAKRPQESLALSPLDLLEPAEANV